MASLFTADLKADSTSSTSCLLHDRHRAASVVTPTMISQHPESESDGVIFIAIYGQRLVQYKPIVQRQCETERLTQQNAAVMAFNSSIQVRHVHYLLHVQRHDH